MKISRLSIKTKFFLSILGIALIVLTVINYISYSIASKSQRKEVYNHLTTSRDLKYNMLANYFNELKEELDHYSHYLIEQTLADISSKNPFIVLHKIATDKKAGKKPDIGEYNGLITGGRSALEKFEYDFESIKNLGEMLLKDTGGENFYIISDKGDIVFSIRHFPDHLMNISHEDFANESILSCVNELRKQEGEDVWAVSELSYYRFYDKKPVFFIGTDIAFGDSRGYIVLMISSEKINNIMLKREGLGRTGETYIVGADYLMRSDSRFILDSPESLFESLKKAGVDKEKINKIKSLAATAMMLSVDTISVKDALDGNSGTMIINDYRAVKALSSYRPFRVDRLNWAIVAEMDLEEAFADIYRLRTRLLAFSTLSVVLLFLLSATLANNLTGRLILLKDGTEQVSRGDYDLNLIIMDKKGDEIDDLTVAFNNMALNLKNMESELKRKNVELEDKVKERTRELKEAKDFSEKVISTAASFIVVTDIKGRILMFNDAFVNISKKLKEELIGTNFFNMLYGDSQGRGLKDSLLASESNKLHFDSNVTIKDSKNRDVSWDASIMPAEGGRDLIVFIGQDMTDRKKLEGDLRSKTEELESFLYSVSHDLKNPTISLSGLIDVFREDYSESIGEVGDFYLKRIKKNIDMINSLLDGIIEISCIGRINRAKEFISTYNIVMHILSEHKDMIYENDIKVDVDRRLPTIFFSKLGFYKIFLNLLANSIKFKIKDVPLEISIGCDESQNEYIFKLKDNGIGIDEKYHEKIFDIFSKLEDETEGIGIGLAIVKRIVEDAGGRVWLESEKDKGSTFYIALLKKMKYPV